jgi:hypothetical protein
VNAELRSVTVPEHEIEISIPANTILNADVVFEVRSDGEKLGELRVSRGTIDWVPRRHQRLASLTWEQFDKLMRDWIDGKR